MRRPFAFKAFWMGLSAACDTSDGDLFGRKVTHFDMKPLKVGYFAGEATLIVDRTGRHLVGSKHTMGDGNTVIVFTEGGSLVNNTSTVRVSDVGVNENFECLVLKLTSVRQMIQGVVGLTRTFSVKYSNNGTYRQSFMSDPWN